MRSMPKRHEFQLLGGLLAVDLLIGIVIVWKMPFDAPTPEYLWPAIEFGTTHHIASAFLSLGYSALIGLGYRVTGSKWGISAVDILICLSIIAAAWAYLRLIHMTVRQTLCLTALLSLYPEFLLSFHKVEDINITALLLFSFLVAVLLIQRANRWGYPDLVLSLVLTAAILVRPNLVLLVPLAWFVLYKLRVPKLVVRAATQALIISLCYVAFTTAVHGRPFFPHNGPYNLYAGANPFTEAHMDNPEDSLVEALAAQGIYATMNWEKQADLPGVTDLRDANLEPLYRRLAWNFIRFHPSTMVRLTWLKFVNLMRPDLRQHRAGSLGGLFKILEAFAIPLWIAATCLLPHPGPRYTRLLVAATLILSVLPMLLTVSPARFRVPLDFVCWMDLGAIVLSWRNKGFNPTISSQTLPQPKAS